MDQQNCLRRCNRTWLSRVVWRPPTLDEDGVADLVSGYEYQGRGIVTVLRGNVDSIYPNSPEAQQRRTSGTLTTCPSCPPPESLRCPEPWTLLGG